MAKKNKTEAEGEVYVWSGGIYYTKPMINADTLRDTMLNRYVFEPLNKLKSTIFTEKFTLRVLNKDREVDEDQTLILTKMAEKVRLWPKMQMSWFDMKGWGIFISSPGYAWVDGVYTLTEIRRLDPYTFRDPAPGSMSLYCDEILNGIVMGSDGQVHYYQNLGVKGGSKEIKNVFIIKDPTSPNMAGTSILIPVVPMVSMMNFTWKSQMQKVNRVGAPIVIIRVKDPQGDDLDYAQQFINNWGKDTAMQLRDNMELVEAKVTDNESALRTIQELKRDIKEYFSPTSLFKKEGETLGGNAAAEKETADAFNTGERSLLEDAWEPIFDPYLEAMGLEGYEVEIRIGAQTTNIGYVEKAQADSGFNTRCAHPNEVRGKLGLEPISDEALKANAELWKEIAPQSAPIGGGFGAGPAQIDSLNADDGIPKEAKDAARRIEEAQRKAMNEIVRALPEAED